MPRSAIHQSDQLKSATSKGAPLSGSPSIELTRKSMVLIPRAACCQTASSMLSGSGSMARTEEPSLHIAASVAHLHNRPRERAYAEGLQTARSAGAHIRPVDRRRE